MHVISSPSGPHSLPQRRDAWTNLWGKGVLHSCGAAFADNYEGPLRLFWQQQFLRLSPGDRLVDIGTGNGAVPLLAAQTLRDKGIEGELHGVDLANINPAANMADGAARYRGICFHPCTSALSLPFADGSVHLLTSHYAFEYMPRKDALAEMLRVTQGDGTIACVLHSYDSIISQTLPAQLDGLDWLFGESMLFAHVHQLLKLEPGNLPAHEVAPPPAATREKFTIAMRGLMQQTKRCPHADILRKAAMHVRKVLQAPAGLGPRILNEAVDSLRDEHERLLQLRAAILSRADLEDLRDQLTRTGRRACLEPIDQAPGIRMGHALIVTHD